MNDKYTPLVSIIIAVYNGANTLQHCLDSITQQTYQKKELIIIDGGSTDATIDLLNEYDEHISYWISEPDSGIYNAWNKGLAKTNGDWVCFLGADDYLWNSHVLDNMVQSLIELPKDIRVAYGQVMLVNNNRENLHAYGEPWNEVKSRFRQLMSIPHPGAMHRSSLFQELGRYNESFRIAGDYELLLRELKTRDAYFIPNIIIVAMMQGGFSSDPAYSLSSLREMRYAQKIHGQRFPGLIWLLAITRVYIRLLLSWILKEKLTNKIVEIYRRIKH